jgi:hypothetical protein
MSFKSVSLLWSQKQSKTKELDKLVGCYLFQNLQHWNPKATGFCFLGDKSSDSGILAGLPIHSTPNMGNAKDPLPSSEWLDPLDLSEASMSSSSLVLSVTSLETSLVPWHEVLSFWSCSVPLVSGELFFSVPPTPWSPYISCSWK